MVLLIAVSVFHIKAQASFLCVINYDFLSIDEDSMYSVRCEIDINNNAANTDVFTVNGNGSIDLNITSADNEALKKQIFRLTRKSR